LLAALAAEEDAWVPPGADLVRPDAIARFLASGARFLVSTSWLGSADELAERVAALPLGRTLVLPTVRRWQLGTPLADVVGPRELALTPAEASELWRQERGEDLDSVGLGALLAATDGWLEPVRLAARGDGLPASAEELDRKSVV
jgi:ATP/maltotriose-dependent transcriptional regulator MalT